jgi:hypothetical protein
MPASWELMEQNKTSLVVGLPVMQNVSLQWALMLKNLQVPPGTRYLSSSGVPVDTARNSIVDDFLKTNAEWLFFLDTDLHVPPDVIGRLMQRRLPIISGLYHTRIPPLVPCVWKVTEQGRQQIPFKVGELIEVEACGAGCLLIHRSVFDRIDKPYFDWTLGRIPEKIRGMSEDFIFFEKCRRAGYKILVDTGIIAVHEMAKYINGLGREHFNSNEGIQ